MIEHLQDTIAPLLFAALLGAVIGLEREMRGRWAGLRTHIMVSLGSAVFVIAGVSSTDAQPSDVSRVIQGVAAGIGFIGAGTIMKLSHKPEVKGLTTSSSIWMASAIGIASGLKLYVLAVSGALISLAVLGVLQRIEAPIQKVAGDERNDD